MKQPTIIFTLALTLILTLLLSGCAPVTVKEINSDPSKYMGKKVTVSGTVAAPLDLGSASGFSLRQDGSSIMVSADNLPKSGSEVVVRGIVVKGLFTSHYIFALNINTE
jgi:hypothetical protein